MIAALTRLLLSKLPTAEAANLLIARVGALPLHRILTTDAAGRLHVRGNPLDIKEQMLLREQAEAILGSSAWKLLRENTLYEAISKGVHEAQTMEQILFSKAALWNIQQTEDLLKTLAATGNHPLSVDEAL